MIPHFPPALEIAIVFLVEFLFGIAFNQLVHWAQGNRIWHVAVSVVIGVFVTAVIPVLFWWNISLEFWQYCLLMGVCFAGSGLPMIYGSTRRTVAKSHKRKRWPTAALRVRDEVVMDLSSLAHEIADKAKMNELTVRDLPDYVNRLYSAIGALKSV